MWLPCSYPCAKDASDSGHWNDVGNEVSVNQVDEAYSASFRSHNDRNGGEEKERQPVPASRGHEHCRNERRTDSDLPAVVHTKLIPFLSLASARFWSPAHLLLPRRR